MASEPLAAAYVEVHGLSVGFASGGPPDAEAGVAANAIAALASAVINMRRITISLPLPLKGVRRHQDATMGDGPSSRWSLACVNGPEATLK